MKEDEFIEQLNKLIIEIGNLALEDEIVKDKILKRLEMFIRNRYGENSHYFNEIRTTDFYFHPPIRAANIDFGAHIRKAWIEGTRKWINILETMIEEIQSFPKSEDADKKNKITKTNQKIFVVHGHDNEMVQTVARFISSFGFLPIILRELPNGGRTIIEKFEDYSDVDFAIILFSPDDVGKSIKEKELHHRPRQNVVFELGFFIGKLGRKNVVVLHKEVDDFEMLSDFQGVLFEPYKDGWEVKVAKEMKAVGLTLDMNKLVE